MTNKINSINETVEQNGESLVSETQLYADSVQRDVDILVNEQTCPNCGASMFGGKCENIDTCGYGHGDDHVKKYIEKKQKLSTNLIGNGQKHQLTTLSGEVFHFYNYYGRIESDKANIQIEANGKKLKMNILYNIVENDDIKELSNIRFIGKVKILEDGEWKDIYIDYRQLKRYISIILLDTRFNKTI